MVRLDEAMCSKVGQVVYWRSGSANTRCI